MGEAHSCTLISKETWISFSSQPLDVLIRMQDFVKPFLPKRIFFPGLFLLLRQIKADSYYVSLWKFKSTLPPYVLRDLCDTDFCNPIWSIKLTINSQAELISAQISYKLILSQWTTRSAESSSFLVFNKDKGSGWNTQKLEVRFQRLGTAWRLQEILQKKKKLFCPNGHLAQSEVK